MAIFPYTAEQIERRLDLIDENKNLLRFPYDYVSELPTGLEDVGDGSILTTATSIPAGSSEIYLKTFELPACKVSEDNTDKYFIHVEVTNIIDLTKSVTNPGFSLILKNATDDSTIAILNDSFELDAATTVKVYLRVPASFGADLVIKPQIEKGTRKTTWAPYMDKIGNYVDGRFNSTNTKINKLLSPVLDFMNLVEIIEITDA